MAEPECLGDGVCTNPRCERHGVERATDGLRDALEDLLRDRAAKSKGTVPCHQLRELLAAHPAEPVGVSDEAVTKALAEYLAENAAGAERDWAMRVALEAVAPLLGTRPQPALDRYEAAWRSARRRAAEYRKAVAFLLNHNASQQLMHEAIAKPLAAAVRPLPTREQIMRALAGVEGRRPDDKSEVWLGAYEDVYGPRADAVLALMGGAEER